MEDVMEEDLRPVACCWCFRNRGLILDAMKCGRQEDGECTNCGRMDGIKLGRASLAFLANRFFVDGSFQRSDFGGAPIVQFNESQTTSIDVDGALLADIRVFEKLLGVGFFYYGPRLWMVGENEQLEALKDPYRRAAVISRIVNEYPTRTLGVNEALYRVRKAPENPGNAVEYDTPPADKSQEGRLNSGDVPVLYASPHVDLCIHECRYTAEDDLYVAALDPVRELKLLDLTHLLREKDVDEFNSLDIAINFIFLAATHAYPITREIAAATKEAGFDGLVYPSYYSLLMSGQMPFRTTYGISHRVIEEMHSVEQAMSLPNVALFGHPVADGIISVSSINRLVIRRVDYEFHFGPLVK